MDNARRIMILDEDFDHLLISRIILERRGFNVMALANCEDLIERIRIFRPAVIFIDHSLPEMTGMQATQLIRSQADCRDIPVVFFSSHENVKDLCAQAGADDFLGKPFKTDELVNMARRF